MVENSNWKIRELGPCDLKEVDHPEIGMIQKAIEVENIKNIAVSGSYGSGKSSVLKSFQNTYSDYKCVNISLALFDGFSKSDNKETKTATTIPVEQNGEEHVTSVSQIPKKEESSVSAKETKHDQLLEASILQQLFYRVKGEDLPFSRFKRIKHITNEYVSEQAVWFFVWFISGIIIFFPSAIVQLLSRIGNVKGIPFRDEINVFALVVALLVFAWRTLEYIIVLLKFANGTKFKKINLKNGELELHQGSDSSVLNKHIDEIIYFFEVTQFEVVIFEDLDRFDNPEIFTKLREINLLLNNCRHIEQKIVFIYAVKDDLFLTESRAKFFDYIVPIVPVITSSNSKEKLKEELKVYGDVDVSDDVLKQIAFYITDMRVLKIIVSDYEVYKKRLSAELLGLDKDQLFCTIVYKNFHPKDFNQLLKNEGKVYDVFSKKKKELQNELVKNYEVEIDGLQKLLKDSDDLYVGSTKDLRILYLHKMMEKYHVVRFSNSNNLNNYINIYHLSEESHFEKLLNKGYKHYSQLGTHNSLQNFHMPHDFFEQIEKEVDPNCSYKEKLQLLELKKGEQQESLKGQIFSIEEKIKDVDQALLKDLLEQIDELERAKKLGLENDDLLFELIKDGLLNEYYHSYISCFYEGELTNNDEVFIRSVRSPKKYEPTLKIDNPQKALDALTENQLKSVSALNKTFVDFLLSQTDVYKQELGQVFSRLEKLDEKAFNFIDMYAGEEKHNITFFAHLLDRCPFVWDKLLERVDNSDELLLKYFNAIICQEDDTLLTAVNTNDSFGNYFSEIGDFSLINLDSEKLIEIIDLFDVKFERIKYLEEYIDVYRHIYANDFYFINPEMVQFIIKYFNENKECKLENLSTSNYSTILKSSCGRLITYIESNIHLYINKVFLPIPTNTEEDEPAPALIRLLNLLTNNNDLVSVLERVNVIISDITKIDSKKNWSEMFNWDKVVVNGKNVLEYYNYAEKLDDCLIRILNNESNAERIAREFKGDGFATPFIKAIISNDVINDTSYRLLAHSYGSRVDVQNLKLSKEKVLALVDANCININATNYEFLKLNYPNSHIQIIENSTPDFYNSLDEFACDVNDLVLMFNSKYISDSDMRSIFGLIDIELMTDAGLADAIAVFLCKPGNQTSNPDRLSAILRNVSSEQLKIKVLIKHFTVFKKDEEITQLIEVLGEKYNELTVEQTNVEIALTEYNDDLLKELQSVGYITSFKAEADHFLVDTRGVDS